MCGRLVHMLLSSHFHQTANFEKRNTTNGSKKKMFWHSIRKVEWDHYLFRLVNKLLQVYKVKQMTCPLLKKKINNFKKYLEKKKKENWKHPILEILDPLPWFGTFNGHMVVEWLKCQYPSNSLRFFFLFNFQKEKIIIKVGIKYMKVDKWWGFFFFFP